MISPGTGLVMMDLTCNLPGYAGCRRRARSSTTTSFQLRIEPQRLLGFDITAGDAEERRILPLPEVWCKLFSMSRQGATASGGALRWQSAPWCR